MAECTCAEPMAIRDQLKQDTQDIVSYFQNNVSGETSIHQTMYGKALGDDASSESGGGGSGGCGEEGKPGAPAPIRFCHWQAPEYGNKGENWWTTLFQAAATTIAIANGLAQQEIADKQQDLAESWYSQAKYKWDRYHDVYIPLEKKLLNEVSSVGIPQLDCLGAENLAQDAVEFAFARGQEYLAQQARALELCIDPSLLQDMSNRRNLMHVDTRNYNYVDDRWYKDYKDDQRWNRRSNILNLGRNLDSQALAYGQVANALYGTISAQLDRAASGVVTALGYFGARNDTYVPTTYLGSGGGAGGNIVAISTPASISPFGLSSSGG